MTRRVVVQRPGLKALVAGGFCAPCLGAELQAQTQAVLAAEPGDLAAAPGDARWTGIVCFERQMTGDGRYIENGALKWTEGAVPLRWAPTDVGAHGGAVVVGLIEVMTRQADGSIAATGFIDRSSEHGAKAYELMRKGLLGGVSVDLDDMEVEIRVKKEIIDAFNEMLDGAGPESQLPAADSEGYIKVAESSSDDQIMVVKDARVRAATLVDIPAFKDAVLTLEDTGNGLPLDSSEVGMLAPDNATAMEPVIVAAAPVRPPADWFESPNLREPTPITITEDGRIYGHAALWNTCHTGYQNSCVTPPRSYTNYAWFRTGDLVTDKGTHIPVGKVTMSTGHASTRLAAAPAAAHYDDTGAVAADVAAGEDKHGVWISGALRPGLTDEQIRELRAAPMSGDWRTVGGNLEMVALLAVNLPGFPVPRTRALVASGRTNTLLSPVPTDIESSSALSRLDKTLRALKIQQLSRGM